MKTTNIDRILEIRSEGNGPRKIQRGLTVLLIVVTLVLFSGCSSVPAQGPDPSLYNFNTEYPAVGTGWPWHSNL